MPSEFLTSELVPSPQQTALFVAAAATPSTFGPSLSARTSVGQGMITALSAGTAYAMTSISEDASRTLARALARTTLLAGQVQGEGRDLWFAIGVDAALVPAGIAILRWTPGGELTPAYIGLLRATARRALITGIAGTLLTAAHAVVRAADQQIGDLPGGIRIARLPLGVPLGFAAAYLMELSRRQAPGAWSPGRARSAARAVRPRDLVDASGSSDLDELASLERLVASDLPRSEARVLGRQVLDHRPRPFDHHISKASRWRSLAVAAGVVGGVTGVVLGEQAVARGLGRLLGSRLPGSPRLWQRVARTGTLGGVGLGLAAVWDRAMQRIEAGAMMEEKVFGEVHGAEIAPRGVSGGPGSLVPWQTLGREGRRHVLSGVAPRSGDRRVLALETDSIESVTGAAPLTEPVQVYIGLDSATTVRARVALALREMDRLGAFDRSLVVLVSPTGTGYVNYAALACLQYLARGDVATVVLQYSRRPSPLAMAQLKTAREQNRLLAMEIARRLRRTPGAGPRVVAFGESLGAHASQDAFLGWGTAGPAALGIDRGLWIGTPAGSKWHRQVMDPRRIDVDPQSVGVFNDIEQLEALPAARRSALRYVLLSHDNDGVTTLTPDLLLRRPAWLDPVRAAERVATPPGRSPRGLPAGMRWLPVTTFYQNLLDMSMAQHTGSYTADAHDYRADLPRFVSRAFDLPVSEEVMARIERAVQRREIVREHLVTVASSDHVTPAGSGTAPSPSPEQWP